MSTTAAFIRDIPDFPEPGIVYKDITPLLANAVAFAEAVESMAAPLADCSIDVVSPRAEHSLRAQRWFGA